MPPPPPPPPAITTPLPTPLPKPTLHPCTPSDFPAIAHLEDLAFKDDFFSDVAFGRERSTPAALAKRADQLLKMVRSGGGRYVKAVIVEGGKEMIVGVAGWSWGVGGKVGGGAEERKGEGVNGIGNANANGEEKGKGKGKDLEEVWGKGANFKLCEDVFVRADEIMFDACGEDEWLKLNLLIIHPTYQRHGIGTLLLKEGLALADKKGVQVVLGASRWGEGLYRKNGFEEVRRMEIRLWEYEGGEEGMGVDSHVVMRRPAVGQRGGKRG